MRPTEFERRIAGAMINAALLDSGDATIVLAVSGGPDSMAMLRALDAFNRRRGLGWRLHVAHFNHGLRGDASDEDARFVAEQARALDLTYTIGRRQATGDRPQAAEEKSRRARYRFLARVADEVGASVVAVAHTADDQAETVLHQIVRGSGLRGVGGMQACRPITPRSRVRLVRPMLGVRRTDVLAYLRATKTPFREDATNHLTDRTRNRIRHRVLPMLAAELNPRVVASLLRLARQSQWTADFLETTAARVLDEIAVETSAGNLVISAAGLNRQPRIVQTQMVLEILRRLRVSRQRVRFEHLCAVADLASKGRGGRRVELPGGVIAARRGATVCVRLFRAATVRERSSPEREAVRFVE
jgi:tRNA(Ile)-lysidine synthase